MAELKTKENDVSVLAFLDSIEDPNRKEDALKFLALFEQASSEKPKMWGKSIVGFGKYHYKSTRSSQEGDWMLCGFSPRKTAFSLYIMSGFEKHEDLLKKLGTFKKSSGCCLYVKKFEDIDTKVLKKLVLESCKKVVKMYSKV